MQADTVGLFIWFTLMTIAPAQGYAAAPDLAVITSFFNPARFVSKRRNYSLFAETILGSGLHLTTVECAMDGAPFQLPIAPNVVRVRSSSILWQKERLLNIAIDRLPKRFTKVAWLDADLLFSSRDWAISTSRALDAFPVVQPYSHSIRLPPGMTRFEGRGVTEDGFCFRASRTPHACTVGAWDLHGQTGFAWAARRDVLTHGLYDRAIAGGADHFMAHAFAGDWESECVGGAMLGNRNYELDYRRWCALIYKRVRARLGWVDGYVLHLWHGSLSNRRYRDRACDLAALEYDPSRDIRVGKSRCWEWTGKNEALERWCRRYFTERQEDTPTGKKTTNRQALISRIRRYRDRAENAQFPFCVDAARSAERAVARASTASEARHIANDFFDWCIDQAIA